jgi:hypothetical protein
MKQSKAEQTKAPTNKNEGHCVSDFASVMATHPPARPVAQAGGCHKRVICVQPAMLDYLKDRKHIERRNVTDHNGRP